MESANEIYALLGKDKKAPGQWLNLRTTKAFIKSTKSKYKKTDDGYLFDEGLLKEYECYLKDQEKPIEEKVDLHPTIKLLKKSFKDDEIQAFLDFFIRRSSGLAFGKIRKVTHKDKEHIIKHLSPKAEHLFNMCAHYLIVARDTVNVITVTWVTNQCTDLFLFFEGRGLRSTYKTIAMCDEYTITYGKVISHA